jgi:hypothetical protein
MIPIIAKEGLEGCKEKPLPTFAADINAIPDVAVPIRLSG